MAVAVSELKGAQKRDLRREVISLALKYVPRVVAAALVLYVIKDVAPVVLDAALNADVPAIARTVSQNTDRFFKNAAVLTSEAAHSATPRTTGLIEDAFATNSVARDNSPKTTRRVNYGKVAHPEIPVNQPPALPIDSFGTTETSEPEPAPISLAEGQSLFVTNHYGEKTFLAISKVDDSTVTAVDIWHNTLKLKKTDVEKAETEFTVSDLTIQEINQAIDQHITFDASFPLDRQLQFKAMVTKFVDRFGHVFPKDKSGKPDINRVFSSGLSVGIQPNEGNQGDYQNNHINLGLTRTRPDMTMFTASQAHEFGHWITDPGWDNTGLNEGIAERIEIAVMETTPEDVGSDLSNKDYSGCEKSGVFTLDDYTRAAIALGALDIPISVPGITDLLVGLGINNKLSGGNALTIPQTEAAIRKHYDNVHNQTGGGPTGETAVRKFHAFTVLYCTAPT